LIYFVVAACLYPISKRRSLRNDTAIVLCYHGVKPKQKACFNWQMSKVLECTSVDETVNPKLCCPEKRWPQVHVTFDDAFENLLENAIPILEKYQVPAIIFAVPGNLGRKPEWSISTEHPDASENAMTEGQLVALSKHPLVRIGSHTQTHPDLSKLSSEQIKEELMESQSHLERLIGQTIEDLALPHGAYNETVLQIASEVGYKRIYTLEPRLVPLERLEKGVVGRFSMSPDVWKAEYILTCAGAYSWLVVWRRLLAAIRTMLKRIRIDR
jgi:peptidoglycan/xylan/chitin deacetylase (PgdA/CDA1 family)